MALKCARPKWCRRNHATVIYIIRPTSSRTISRNYKPRVASRLYARELRTPMLGGNRGTHVCKELACSQECHGRPPFHQYHSPTFSHATLRQPKRPFRGEFTPPRAYVRLLFLLLVLSPPPPPTSSPCFFVPLRLACSPLLPPSLYRAGVASAHERTWLGGTRMHHTPCTGQRCPYKEIVSLVFYCTFIVALGGGGVVTSGLPPNKKSHKNRKST